MSKFSNKVHTGDGGQTFRADGVQVSKADPCVEVCGEIDELNSHIGLLVAYLSTSKESVSSPAACIFKEWCAELNAIQRHLFAIGALMAGASSSLWLPGAAEVSRMDIFIAENAVPFSGFVLPGGQVAAAQAHICRTVCRRVERRVLAAGGVKVLPYLNRLSDFFFTLSLKINEISGIKEIKL